MYHEKRPRADWDEVDVGDTPHGASTLDETPAPGLAAASPARPPGNWWPRLALAAVVLIAAGMRLYRLDQNGYGTDYYTSAVRGMVQSWHNFFYNSFDPGGFISVDKPPVAFWIQAASAKVFGFSGLSVLVPQAVEGVLSVLLVYSLVRRRFGVWAGVAAGLFLALSPINVAADRSSNTDSCLVLFLLLSAWVLVRATEKGSWLLLLLSMVLAGVAFNVKMLMAAGVYPIFYVVYFLGAPVNWRARLGDLTLATVVLGAVSLSWAVAFDLTPPENRPYAGSTKDNSMLELIVGHNGVERFVRRGRGPGAPGTNARAGVRPTRPPAPAGAPADPAVGQPADPGAGVPVDPATGRPPFPAAQPGGGFGRFGGPGGPGRTPGVFPGGSRPGFGGRAPIGSGRLVDPHLASQFAWLLPLALAGLFVGVFQSRLSWPLSAVHLQLLMWFGWALTYGVIYSYAGGIFHEYYLVTLGPPLAGLAGIGLVGLWSCYRRGGWRTFLLPVTLILTAVWQGYVQYGYVGWKPDAAAWRDPGVLFAAVKEHLDFRTWLYLALGGGSAVAVLGLLLSRLRRAWIWPARVFGPAALAVGLLALLATPTAWALSNVLARGNNMLPSANLSLLVPRDPNGPRRGFGGPGAFGGFGGFGGAANNQKLIAFLQANHQGERFLLATQTTQQAAPIIIQTGEAVMAMGGFMGSDPVLTPEKFAHLVEEKQIRFVMSGGGFGEFGGFGRRTGAGGESREKTVADWVREHGKAVDPALWRAPLPPGLGGNRFGPRPPIVGNGDLNAPRPPGPADGNGNRQRRAAAAGNGPNGQPPAADGPNAPRGRNRGGFPGGRAGGMQLYDLRPEAGIVQPPTE